MQTDFKHRDASKGSYILQSQTVSNQNSDTELRRVNHEGKDFREFLFRFDRISIFEQN